MMKKTPYTMFTKSHREPSYTKAHYFMVRNWGNLLFGGADELLNQFKYFESRGGVFRQFFFNQDLQTELANKIFHRFGASAVIPRVPEESELPFHPELRFEQYKVEFFDPDVFFYSIKRGLKWNYIVVTKLDERTYIMLNEDIVIEDQVWKLNPRGVENKTLLIDALRHIQENHQVDYVCPLYFRGNNPPYTIMPGQLQGKIDQLC
jgi:hypothetical protein